MQGQIREAAILIAQFPDLAPEVLKMLPESERNLLVLEIANMRTTPEEVERVFVKFLEQAAAVDAVQQGSVELARDILVRMHGPEKADEVLKDLSMSIRLRPFDFLARIDATQLTTYLQELHPQVVALILSFVADQDQKKAAQILAGLEPKQQVAIFEKIANLDSISPDVVQTIEAQLEKKLGSSYVSQKIRDVGGLNAVVAMMGAVDRATERQILGDLEKTNPKLAEEVKKRLFTFEDLLTLSRRDVGLVLQKVKDEVLVMALRGTNNEALKQYILENISQRRQKTILEDLEASVRPKRSEINDAQQSIALLVRQLDQEGLVSISKGGEDY